MNKTDQEKLDQESVSKLEHEAEEARASLVSKLQMVEDRVREKVDDVKTSVNQVKDSMDVKKQVVAHPLAMVGGSIFAGLVIGSLFAGKKSTSASSESSLDDLRPVAASLPEKVSIKPSLFDKFVNEFGAEINMVKGMAVGAAVELLREKSKASVPQFAPYVNEVAKSLSNRFAYKGNGHQAPESHDETQHSWPVPDTQH